MNYQDETRANIFDRWVGYRQTLKCMGEGLGDSLLDVGCGIGEFTPLYLQKFKRVVGLDPSKEYLEEARKKNNKVEYIEGWGESFKLNEKFDTIVMNNLLEHVVDPRAVLSNCAKHLSEDGILIAMVPNSNSIARRLGVAMGLIDNIGNISDKERYTFGHKRTYTLNSLERDGRVAGLEVVKIGGLLYKPLPNEILLRICQEKGRIWRDQFIDALIAIGEDKPEDCAQIYIICVLP